MHTNTNTTATDTATTKVFVFDNDTGEFLREEDTFLCPIKKVPLLPPNGTFSAPPPDIPPSYVAAFGENKWHVIPDNRGKTVFDLETRRFLCNPYLGVLPPNEILVDKAVEEEYRNYPYHFEVTPNSFRRLSEEEIARVDVIEAQKEKRWQRDILLSKSDWMISRATDQNNNLEVQLLRNYRQYLRDFTARENWGQLTIDDFQQFTASQESSTKESQ
jgi:hypothetical protein